MRDCILRRFRRDAIIAIALMAAFWLAFAVQTYFILPAQRLFFPESTIAFVSLLHGVRIIAAWQFGWLSVVLLGPNAALLAILLSSGLQTMLTFDFMPFVALSLIYLASGPLSFSLLHWADIGSGKNSFLDWRRVMIAGLFSSVINVKAQTWLFPPDLDLSLAIVQMVFFSLTMVFGVFCVLLALLLLLRLVPRSNI